MNGARWKLKRRQLGAHFLILSAAVCCALTLLTDVAVAKASVPEPIVLVLGDSLSAEYGLQRGTGWVNLLSQQLSQGARPAKVINASVSGETTAGGRSRLPALLKQYRPTHVILELGANDALRGLALDATHANLQAMATATKAMGAKVLLVGLQIPPNYGRQYSEDFAKIFSQLAQAERLALVPFLLKGVADNPRSAELFQADRIHPNEQAQRQMLNNVWPVLKSLL